MPSRGQRIEGTTEAEGMRVKEQVLRRLTIHAKNNGWTRSQVETKSLVLVCPWPSNENPLTSGAGQWIIAAVKEFLDIPSKQRIERRCAGFLADLEGSNVLMLRDRGLFGMGTLPTELSEFDVVQVKGEEWRFEIAGPNRDDDQEFRV
jgi:hypothetical protein